MRPRPISGWPMKRRSRVRRKSASAMMHLLPSLPNNALAATLRCVAVWLAALLVVLGALAAPAIAQPAGPAAVPALEARGTDTTSTPDASRRQALEQSVAAFHQPQGAQLAGL